MTEEPDSTNPYASPASLVSERKNEGSFRDDLAKQLRESRQNRARWAAICMLNGCAVFTVGLFLLIVSDNSTHDSVLLGIIGACLIAVSILVFFIGPILWYRFKTEKQDCS